MTTPSMKRMGTTAPPTTRILETRKSSMLCRAKDDIVHLLVSHPSLTNAQGKPLHLPFPNVG
jgi:hypothetical protein